jgi:hypothetical protein
MSARGAELSSIGINKATTFTGFCSHHDSELFKEIDFSDTHSFDPKNIRQVVLLALRSVAREYWAKANAVRIYDEMVSIARSGDIDTIKEILNTDDEGAVTFVSNVDTITKPYLDGSKVAKIRLGRVFRSIITQVEKNKYHLSRFETYCVGGARNITASGLCLPEFDLRGKRICLPLPGADIPEVAASVLPQEDKTWIVFWYHKRFSAKLDPLFNQLRGLNENELRISFSKFLVIHAENVAYSPRLVAEMPENLRLLLGDIFEKTLYLAVPYGDVPSFDLFSDDGQTR